MSPKIARRRSNLGDEAFLRALHKAVYQDVVARQFGRWDDEIQRAFFTKEWVPEKMEIVELEGKSIGCISVLESPDKIAVLEIQILPECQGRGIGSGLMKEEIENARRLNKPLRLQVLRENKKARAFYERLGFTVDGETEHHFTMSIA